jgi:enterochelin esterase-like enzyme
MSLFVSRFLIGFSLLMFLTGSTEVISQEKPKKKPTTKPKNDLSKHKWINLVPAENRHKRLQHGTFDSKKQNTKVGYYIYLPQQYDDPKFKDHRFPVVYYLHGGRPGGEQKSIKLTKVFDDAISSGKVPPMLYVFVNGGVVSHYDYPEKNSYGETVFITELIPHIDATYRTIADRKGRALEGFSQGGRGTARLSFKHPHVFCSAAPMGGGHSHEKRISENDGDEGTLKFEQSNNTWDLATAYAKDKMEKYPLRVLVAVGSKGFNYENNLEYMEHLKKLGIPFTSKIAKDAPHSAMIVYEKLGTFPLEFHAESFRLESEK